MNPWTTYQSRLDARGGSMRGAVLSREKRYLAGKLPNSLSYHSALIDGKERQLAIINSDNLDEKTLCSMPGEDLPHGGLVEWMDNHWLIVTKDANNEVYTRATMKQCNYLLKWVSPEKNIIKRWCIIEDGTKYLTGVFGDKDYIFDRGDSRVSMIIQRDSETIRLNRTNRFMIDDYDSPNILAYKLTKPFKLGGSYNGDGVLSFVLTECQTEDTDNFDLHIANYYQYFPRPECKCDDENCPMDCHKDEDNAPDQQTPDDGETGRRRWL